MFVPVVSNLYDFVNKQNNTIQYNTIVSWQVTVDSKLLAAYSARDIF